MTDVPVAMTEREMLFVGGRMVPSSGSERIEVVSPHSEEVIGRVPAATPADMDAAVAAARAAFDAGPWPRMSLKERLEVLTRLSDLLKPRAEEIGKLITRQNGSPYSWSVLAQAYAPILVLDCFVGLAQEFPFERSQPGMLGPVLVRGEPVGVVAAVTPWNTPLFVTMSKLAPALSAGCTMVLKPSPETPLDAYLLAELAAEAGLPEGVLSVVPAEAETSAYLVSHPGIDMVAFTGSLPAGKKIMAACAENLTRVVLELGGKSAAILLPDADLDSAIPGVLPNAIMNNGQACVAQSRILAPRERYGEVVDRLAAGIGALKVGDPLDPATEVGPLITQRHRDRVQGYVRAGEEEGARVVAGGSRPADQPTGWYLEPTLLADVDNGMRVAREEIFGPVVCVIPYTDADEAVRIANDSNYGLSGSVWTGDVERGIDIARQVRTGNYAVNGFGLEFSAPFGGFKQSGLGREFGPEGLAAYVEYKTIHLPADYTPAG
jgi:acyl-CoA reductase-like NAD-dependent aldehyde dehydrogenase